MVNNYSNTVAVTSSDLKKSPNIAKDCYKGFLNQHKNDEMVNNYSYTVAVTSSNLKNPLILLKIVSNIVLEF